MSQPFVAEIRMLPYSFAPRSWASCSGQTLSIVDFQMLYAVVGTTYGGNGSTTLGLPNMTWGAAPMHSGQGPGITYKPLGQTYGFPKLPIHPNELPSHDHQNLTAAVAAPNTITSDASSTSLLTKSFNEAGGRAKVYGEPQASTVQMSDQAIGDAGQGQYHDNRQPYLCIPFCIALDGLWPSRP